ncbi:MAG TPA: hypothetical protein V6D11_14965 [Waterburya sp.]|jgi:hypothetical protein
MDFDELKDRVQSLVTCMVGQDKAVAYAIDDDWLRPIHEDQADRRNETLLAQAWVREVETRKQAIANVPTLTTGATPILDPNRPGHAIRESFPGGETA